MDREEARLRVIQMICHRLNIEEQNFSVKLWAQTIFKRSLITADELADAYKLLEFAIDIEIKIYCQERSINAY